MVASGGKYSGVSIRQFWKPKGSAKLAPSKYAGLTLKVDQWRELLRAMPALESKSKPLGEATICDSRHKDDENQMGYYSCGECCPFGIIDVKP